MIITDKDIDLTAFIGKQESQEIRSPIEFISDIDMLIEMGDTQAGKSLPWSKADEIQKLRGGELSIWAGVNGHGKSQLLGQVILNRMTDQRCLIASLEMKPSQTLYRMICQYTGCRPSKDFANKVLNKFENRLWIYDQLDTVDSERILGMVHYAAHELGIEHVVIDSLIKCGLGKDDYDKQSKFVDRLQWAAKTYDIHVHLVCHMRKKENEHQRAGKFDIRGAGEISDLADNVFVVHRNKAKEEEKNKLKSGKGCDEKRLSEPDTLLSVAKNRHGGKEGLIGLWFHEESMQYVPNEPTALRGVMREPF